MESKATLRHRELLETLRQRHPESVDYLRELDNLNGDLVVEAETAAEVNQGRVIMAAIAGDLTAWPGCEPQWDNRPSDLEVAS